MPSYNDALKYVIYSDRQKGHKIRTEHTGWFKVVLFFIFCVDFTPENELRRRWFPTDEFQKKTSPKMDNMAKFRNLKLVPLSLAKKLQKT